MKLPSASNIFLLIFTANISETITDEVLNRHYGPDVVVAEIKKAVKASGENESGEENDQSSNHFVQWRMSDVAVSEKLEKFVEDVK